MIRRSFYLLIGFTFPLFWAFHADGTLGALYMPLQRLFGTDRSGWPSLITALILYTIAIILFEVVARTRRNLQP